MKYGLTGILTASLLTISAAADGANTAIPVPTADDASTDSIAAEAAPTAEEKLAEANALIEKLTAEKNALKREVRTLSDDNRTMQAALTAALPYAEAGIKSHQSFRDTDFDSADLNALKRESTELRSLAPYSDVIKAQADTIDLFISITGMYRQSRDFDTQPFSDSLIGDAEKNIFAIIDAGGGMLTEIQSNQIDSLYNRISAYRQATEAFDRLIKDIDAATDSFRDNPKGDNLAKMEIANVKEQNAENIQAIQKFRYLASLYDRYSKELDKTPRSRTEDIRMEIGRMLGDDNTPAADGNGNAAEATDNN